ncbi:hypothetical protein [Neisseria musculi]|uniref:hypothetical protein n=1 Tax=Neisseria musculi TaxID=1815583 RepID=UPI00164C0373|nr:hypothetical protein [Neisseria musculi]
MNSNDEYQTHCEQCGAELTGEEKLCYGWLCPACDDEVHQACLAEIEEKEKP